MEQIEYKARILPDGHLPLPEGIPAKAGDEVHVTITLPETPDAEAKALKQWEHLRGHWMGAIETGLSDGALRHDDYIYGSE